MEITITSRHFDLPERVRQLITKKQRKFDKYATKIINLHLIISRDKSHFTAEGKVDLKYGLLTSQSRHPDLGVAVSAALDKLFTQLHKEDERIKERWKRGKKLP